MLLGWSKRSIENPKFFDATMRTDKRMRARVGAWHAQCRLIMWHSYVPRGTGVHRFFTRCQFRNVTGVSRSCRLVLILLRREASFSLKHHYRIFLEFYYFYLISFKIDNESRRIYTIQIQIRSIDEEEWSVIDNATLAKGQDFPIDASGMQTRIAIDEFILLKNGSNSNGFLNNE